MSDRTTVRPAEARELASELQSNDGVCFAISAGACLGHNVPAKTVVWVERGETAFLWPARRHARGDGLQGAMHRVESVRRRHLGGGRHLQFLPNLTGEVEAPHAHDVPVHGGGP